MYKLKIEETSPLQDNKKYPNGVRLDNRNAFFRTSGLRYLKRLFCRSIFFLNITC